MEITTIIGVLGAGIILVFFILEQIDTVTNKDFSYDLGNFVGSLLLIAYAYMLHSVPFIILNTVWAIVSLRDVVARLLK